MGILNTFFGTRSATLQRDVRPKAGPAESDLMTRAVRMEREEMNEEDRTLPAILATEGRVLVYDYRSGRVIEEVLIAAGGVFAERMTLLDSHSRYSSHSVLGGVRNIRVDGDKIRGMVRFGKDYGDDVDRIWERVRQGDLTDGSIGYRYGDDDYVDIAPGQTAKVLGRTWKAGNQTLRIVTSWEGREYSVTPIGADKNAKLNRSDNLGSQNGEGEESSSSNSSVNGSRSQDNGSMNKALRRFLVMLGMRADVTDEQAEVFRGTLQQQHAERADRIASGQEDFSEQDAGQRSDTTDSQEPGDGGVTGNRSELGSQQSFVDPRQAANEALQAERGRQAHIDSFDGQVSTDLLAEARRSDWDQNEINRRFLEDIRGSRSEAVTPGGLFAIHDASRNAVSIDALKVISLQRAGVNLDDDRMRSPLIQHVLNDSQLNSRFMSRAAMTNRHGGNLNEAQERAFEVGQRHSHMHFRDVVRHALQIEGARFDYYDQMEMKRYAVSSAAVQEIFTVNFAVQFMTGFMGKPDTTLGWTREADLPNLQKVERKQMGKASPLKKRVKGQKAQPVTIDAIGEEYKLAEYSGEFFVDIQDVIDDRFGALDVMPDEMGEAAAEIRAKLVYALLLSNPVMGRDGLALFHASRNNLHVPLPLSSENLATAKTAMSTQVKGEGNEQRLIGVQPRGLVVPDSKEDLAWELVNSPEKRDNTDGKVYGTRNWAQGRFNVVPEPMLDVGVVDPDTETFVAPRPGSQFLVAEGGNHGIEVGFLQGSGRRPTLRRFTATEGRFGFGYDIQHFVASKAVGYEGLAEMRDS